MISSPAFSVRTNDNQYAFAFKWGSLGNGKGQFLRPHDIEFDSKGNVYVSDRDKNDIQKFTPNGTFILKWGRYGTGDGELNVPYSISIDKRDNVYVVDMLNNRIQKFDNNGIFIKKWDKFDAKGHNNTLFHPEDMAINPRSGDIYVADTGNNRTIKLDHNFHFIKDWGSLGSGEGEFNHPHGIAVDSSGHVYVNEALNARIQKFDSNGNYLTQVGSGPCRIPDDIKQDPVRMALYNRCDGKLDQPEHANINSKGDLYVVDRGNQRVVVYSPKAIK